MLLVTGGAGFIGSHLVDRLLGRGDDVLCIDDFNNSYDPAIKRQNIDNHLTSRNFTLIEADIRDFDAMERVFKGHKISKVVHLAACVGVRQSVDDPLPYERTNILGTLTLLELSRRYEIEHFVFASSSSVYGAQTRVPFTEDMCIDRTVSPYAATKYAGELMCRTYHHLYGFPVTCLRFFTAYGPRQRPEMAIHKFTRLIFEGKPIPLFGDGSTRRDYTYVDDIIQGVVAGVDRAIGFEIFNLGESSTVSLRDLIVNLEMISGRKAILDLQPQQPGDVEVTYADVSKARRLLDYNPTTTIQQGLKAFIEWFEHNQIVRSGF